MKRLALLTAALLAGCTNLQTSDFVGWLPSHQVVVAHRGGAHLAPENTLPAFFKAQEPGIEAEVIELDLHRSADGVIVVHHDKSIDRMTGQGNGCDIEQDDGEETFGSVLIKDLSLLELQSHDAGYCFEDLDGANSYRGQGVVVPTLREVLTTLSGQRFVLEVKQHEPSIIDELVALVDELGAMSRVCFLAFDEADTERLGELLSDRPESCMSLSSSGIRCFAGEQALPFGGVPCEIYDLAVLPHEREGFDFKDPGYVAGIRQTGMAAFMWTLNDRALLAEALALGLDGVITDRPDLARELIGDLGRGEDEQR